MGKAYSHLTMNERNGIHHRLKQLVSTVTLVIAHNAPSARQYEAAGAARTALSRRRRGTRKLWPDSALFARVPALMEQSCSPLQIAATLWRMHPHDPSWHAATIRSTAPSKRCRAISCEVS